MEEHGKSFKKGVAAGIALTLAVILTGFGAIKGLPLIMGQGQAKAVKAGIDRTTKNKLKTLGNVIDELYLYSDDIDTDSLREGIYKGYVSALGDPYTTYYDKEETAALMEATSGEYSGIGAVLSQNRNTGIVVVNSVYEDSPAQRGGLADGDMIYQVDSHVLQGEDLSEIVTWIRGEKGTDVVLHVYRGEKMKDVECRITRDIIEAKTVDHKLMEDNIGYLRIVEFDEVTFKQFKEALTGLEDDGMKALVIDLRSNPGGSLSTTVEMLKLILPKGVIVSTRDKNGFTEEYKNDEDHRFNKPLAVLVDGYSASASEIFSGAVKDYGVGVIVGTTTFGKGIVQQILDLRDGTSVKVTISEYFTPNGENIHGKGIQPDEVVELPSDISQTESDIQLDRAIEIVKDKLK